MHAVFIPYGKRECVDVLARDLAAQKLPLRIWKKGEPDETVFIECQLRVLPFGIWEFVFPREFQDQVLTSLDFHKEPPYNLNKEIGFMGLKIRPFEHIKKFLKIEDTPEFKTDKTLILMKEHISLIPIGVRYDDDITEVRGEKVGWTHESI